MHWSTLASTRTTARPEQIWRLWADVAQWNRWDGDVETSHLEGSFVEGARGYLKPKGGPKTKFVLTHVEPFAAFSDRSSLPLTTLDFIHTMRVEGVETVIEHRVEMNGPLTFLFRRIIGAGIARGLPSALERLARLAEAAEL